MPYGSDLFQEKAGKMLTCDYESPLGRMLLAADDTGLTGAWFYGQRYFAYGLEDAEKNVEAETPALAAARRWLDAYFAGGRPDVAAVPLARAAPRSSVACGARFSPSHTGRRARTASSRLSWGRRPAPLVPRLAGTPSA